jgi:hypothetical protein
MDDAVDRVRFVSARGTIRLGADIESRDDMATMLERVAEDVRRGRCDCIALACVLSDGGVGTAYGQAEGQEKPFALLGALDLVRARVLGEVQR